MLGEQHHSSGHRSIKFYLFMATLVVVGLFVVLFWNNSGNKGITNAIIGMNKADLSNTTSGDDAGGIADSIMPVGSNTLAVSLSFNKVPSVKRSARVEELELHFNDFNSAISVNNDHLELSNVGDEVSLLITDFSGKLAPNGDKITLSGKAKKIEVNGIAFSSDGSIQISFDNLHYNSLAVTNMDFNDLEFEAGSGNLQVGDKLEYNLEDEGVQLAYFKGSFNVGEPVGNATIGNSLVKAEGTIRGVSVTGGLLDLALS
ncbi:MAG: hypothetical protein AB1668_03675 [Nanoarchaeota archaeon]